MRRATEQQVLGYLREIRAAAQVLQLFLSDANAAALTRTAAERVAFFATEVAGAVTLRARTDQIMTDSLAAIRAIFANDPEMRDWCSDYVVRIELARTKADLAWPAPGAAPDDIAEAFRRVVAELDAVVFQCASLTISPRVNDVLENMRVGQALRFSDEFAEELPLKAESKVRLFRELVAQDGAMPTAYIDEESGLIYRVAATRSAQRWSVARIVAAPFVGLSLAALACHAGTWLDLQGWPLDPTRTSAVLANYAFVFVGAAVHLVITAVTAAHARAEPRRSPWNDWILWFNAHEVLVLYGVLYVFLGFAFLTLTTKDLGWQTAFFAGYSVDSLIDVFLDRFGRLAKTATASLVKDSKGAPAEPANANA